MTRLAVVSDIKLDNYSKCRDVAVDILSKSDKDDVIVIPGNLGTRDASTMVLLHLSLRKPVIYVPGLMEFDGSSVDVFGWIADLSRRLENTPNPVLLLNNSTGYYDLHHIVGTPLWLDPDKIPHTYRTRKPYSEEKWKTMYKRLHTEALEFLDNHADNMDIVVTHYAPTKEILPLNVFGTDLASMLSPSLDNLDELEPKVWICSNAEPIDIQIGLTRYVSNPVENYEKIKIKSVVV